MIESHKRSILKAITWRCLATLTTMIVVYIFTKEFLLSLEIGGLGLIAKLFLYYLYERIWNNINWGRVKHPLSNLPVNKELDPEDLQKVQNQLKDLGYIE